MRLVDFQVSFGVAAGGPSTGTRTADQAAFPIYEAIRLWLKERKVEAPFRTIVVSVTDVVWAEKMHGPNWGELRRASSVLSICEVYVIVANPIEKGCAGDPRWLGDLVLDGLRRIDEELSWRNGELDEQVDRVARARPPCAHRFAKLHRKHRGTACDLWFIAEAGRSQVKARFTLSGGHVEEVVLAEAHEPLYLEDDFPVRSVVVKDGVYIPRDREKRELAHVPIPVASQ